MGKLYSAYGYMTKCRICDKGVSGGVSMLRGDQSTVGKRRRQWQRIVDGERSKGRQAAGGGTWTPFSHLETLCAGSELHMRLPERLALVEPVLHREAFDICPVELLRHLDSTSVLLSARAFAAVTLCAGVVAPRTRQHLQFVQPGSDVPPHRSFDAFGQLNEAGHQVFSYPPTPCCGCRALRAAKLHRRAPSSWVHAARSWAGASACAARPR